MTSFNDFIDSFKTIEPLSNFQILDICNDIKLKKFKGVFMRDQLNIEHSDIQHCLILNLDTSKNIGTHWTCLYIKKNKCIYFDPFGFAPPKEIEAYCKGVKNRVYSSFPIQKPNTVICAHYCIYFLYKLMNGKDLFSLTDELYSSSH